MSRFTGWGSLIIFMVAVAGLPRASFAGAFDVLSGVRFETRFIRDPVLGRNVVDLAVYDMLLSIQGSDSPIVGVDLEVRIGTSAPPELSRGAFFQIRPYGGLPLAIDDPVQDAVYFPIGGEGYDPASFAYLQGNGPNFGLIYPEAGGAHPTPEWDTRWLVSPNEMNPVFGGVYESANVLHAEFIYQEPQSTAAEIRLARLTEVIPNVLFFYPPSHYQVEGSVVLADGTEVSVQRDFFPDIEIISDPAVILPTHFTFDGHWLFEDVPGDGWWFDPVATEGYVYETDGASRFTHVQFPSMDGFFDSDGFYTVYDAANGVRLVAAGELLEFEIPVERFEVTGIGPPVVAENPFGFETFLVFDERTVTFTMTPIPEACWGVWVLLWVVGRRGRRVAFGVGA